MKHKILAASLSVSCLCSAMPITAFAAETAPAVQIGTFQYLPSCETEAVTETYFYSDQYFTAPASKRNDHLTSMPLALACSTFENLGASYVTELYDNIVFTDVRIDDMNEEPKKGFDRHGDWT